MSRYEHTKIKTSLVTRGLANPQVYNITSNGTTIYSSIPESDTDIWVITQTGDRLDLLAQQFYSDVNLWWYIAKANNLTFIHLPAGISLRIPASIQYAIGI
ncbi:hypothetical protein CL614_08130 [archaeon]|nr:hypothetical protein [archaeon]|tara:strand:- start:1502 stop:1804 length:303 start_codon:yes stop_codon:yes gene_type:complete